MKKTRKNESRSNPILSRGGEKSASRDSGQEAVFFLILILVFGLLIVFIMPPITAPDEDIHFVNSWALSSGQFLPKEENGEYVYSIPEELNEFINRYYKRFVTGDEYGKKYSVEDLANDLSFSVSSEKTARQYYLLSSFGYAVSAASMKTVALIGALFGSGVLKNPYIQMQAGRLGNLCFYAIVVYLAIKRAPHFKRTIGLTACLPMAIFLGCSLSYDAMLIPLTLYYFSLVLSVSQPSSGPLRKADMIKLFLCAALLSGIKIGYAPFLFFLLVIPFSAFGSKKKMAFFIAGAVLSGFIGALPSLLNLSSHDKQLHAALRNEQTNWLLQHPFQFPGILLYTFISHFSFYINGFWGILGWLDIPLPSLFVTIGWGILLLVGLYESFTYQGWENQRWKNGMAFISVLISMLCFYVYMYIDWTPRLEGIGAPFVEGIQGRYFIPYFLPIMVTVSNGLGSRFDSDRLARIMSYVSYIWSAVCVMLTFLILFVFYWL